MKNREGEILKRLDDKTIEKIQNKAVTYFEKREYALPLCPKCHKEKISAACSYPLRGSKEGQTCGKILCDSCVNMVDDRPYCRAHARIVEKENENNTNSS